MGRVKVTEKRLLAAYPQLKAWREEGEDSVFVCIDSHCWHEWDYLQAIVDIANEFGIPLRPGVKGLRNEEKFNACDWAMETVNEAEDDISAALPDNYYVGTGEGSSSDYGIYWQRPEED